LKRGDSSFARNGDYPKGKKNPNKAAFLEKSYQSINARVEIEHRENPAGLHLQHEDLFRLRRDREQNNDSRSIRKAEGKRPNCRALCLLYPQKKAKKAAGDNYLGKRNGRKSQAQRHLTKGGRAKKGLNRNPVESRGKRRTLSQGR